MKKQTNRIVLRLDAPVTLDEAEACIHMMVSGLNKYFDEDGNQLFRPEALNLVRNAFARLSKRRKRKASAK